MQTITICVTYVVNIWNKNRKKVVVDKKCFCKHFAIVLCLTNDVIDGLISLTTDTYSQPRRIQTIFRATGSTSLQALA